MSNTTTTDEDTPVIPDPFLTDTLDEAISGAAYCRCCANNECECQGTDLAGSHHPDAPSSAGHAAAELHTLHELVGDIHMTAYDGLLDLSSPAAIADVRARVETARRLLDPLLRS